MKTSNKFLPGSFGFLLSLILVSGALAQGRVDKYKSTTFTGTWTDISGTGTHFEPVLWWGYNGYGSASISLPFAFTYDNTAISAGATIGVSPNATIFFKTSPTTTASVLGNSGYPGAVSVFGGGLCNGDGNNGGTDPNGYDNWDYYQTNGTSPNRVFIIQYRRIHFPNNGGGTNTSLETEMEVKLYETTNIIEFIYKEHSKSLGYLYYPPGCDIGLNGFTSPSFVSNKYATGLSSTPGTDIRWSPPLPPAELSLQPKSINFGPVNAGLPVTANMVLYSSGSAILHILGYTMSGAPDYTMTVAPITGDVITPGTQRTYTVQFNPITSGPRTATFTIITDGADSGTQSCSLTGIGVAPAVAYGTAALFHKMKNKLGNPPIVQYIPITSTGTGPLTINSIYFIGLNPDSYTLTRFPQSPLPVGATDSIGIGFSPKLEGRPDASVVISTNGLNMPWDTVSLWGIGTLPHLVLTTNISSGSNVTMQFDSVALGDSICQSLALHNTGSDTLLLLKQLVTSSDYDFSFYPLKGTDTMLVPDQTKLVNICFRPIKAGARLASIRFFTNIRRTFETPSRDTSQFNVSISGTGVPFGRLAFQGAVADSVIIGNTHCITGTLTNTGQVDFTVSKDVISGLYGSEYSLTWIGGGPSFTLAPNATKSVTICFTPADRGPRPAVLTLTGVTSDMTSNVTIALAGYGLHICGTPTPSAIYDTVLLGAKDSRTIIVENCGDVYTNDTASFSATTSPSFALNSAAGVPNVAPAANATFTILFSPTALGAATGMVNLVPSPAIPPIPLYGWGIGVLTQGSNNPASVTKDGCVNDTISFTNNGNIDWTPGSPTLSGADAANFTIVSSTTTATPPGGIVTVILKFCPTNVGQDSVTIDFPSSSPAPYAGTPYSIGATAMPTGSVAERSEQNGFVLGQCYPNPTNATAQVVLSMPVDASVRMDILDATGNAVRNAFSGLLATGDHTLSIDAKGLASGTYYYVVTSGDVRLTREMVLVK